MSTCFSNQPPLDNIDVVSRPGRDRCAIYSPTNPSSLHPGDIVTSNLPLAVRPFYSSLTTRCARCLCRSIDADSKLKLRRCGACRDVWYCGRRCQMLDWNEGGHKYECQFVSKWRNKWDMIGQGGDDEREISGSDENRSTTADDAFLLLRAILKSHEVGREDCRKVVESTTPSTSTILSTEIERTIAVECGGMHFRSMHPNDYDCGNITSGASGSNNSSIADMNNEWWDEVASEVAMAANLAILSSIEAVAASSSEIKQPMCSKNKLINKQTSGQMGKTKLTKKKKNHYRGGEVTIHEVKSVIRKFHYNNFAICDSLLRPIAAGIYPRAALLNHSCVPNCLIRYDINSCNERTTKAYTPLLPRLTIVACRTIKPGEELCHSYIDLAIDSVSKTVELRDKYGITHGLCGCERCQGIPLMVHWDDKMSKLFDPFFWENDPPSTSNSMLCPWDQFYASEVHTDANLITTNKVNKLLTEADIALSEGRDIDELRLLQDASHLFDNSLNRKCYSNGQYGINPSLLGLLAYKIAGRLLSSSLANGNSKVALDACARTVSCLCVCLRGHCVEHSHPLLALQLFTYADLLEGTGRKEDATRAYQWSRRVLRISCGCDNKEESGELVKRLDNILSGRI